MGEKFLFLALCSPEICMFRQHDSEVLYACIFVHPKYLCTIKDVLKAPVSLM